MPIFQVAQNDPFSQKSQIEILEAIWLFDPVSQDPNIGVCPNMARMALNGPKWAKMGQNDPKMVIFDPFWLIWLGMDMYG